ILATSVEVAPSIIGEHSWEPVRISSKKRTAEELQTFHTSDLTCNINLSLINLN
ncbi:MAG: hypothetical protein RLZ12_511, partial [Bacillota bacterium]